MKTTIYALVFVALGSALQAQGSTAVLPNINLDASQEVTAADLRAHVEWLASDELEGRGTGTPSIDLAAEYIAREFLRYGLQPAGDNGTFFQTFDVITGAQSSGNSLAWQSGGESTTLDSTQFMPYAFSASGSFTGTPVYAGYGIVATGEDIDDYAGLSVEGRVVIVRSGYPDDVNPHGSVPVLASVRGKEVTAREKGASALLVIMEEGKSISGLKYDGSPARTGIPVGRITAAAARRLLTAAGVEGKIDGEFKKGPAARGPMAKGIPARESGSMEVQGRFNVDLIRKQTRNVLALLPGSNSDGAEGVFVIGGHYDHLGWGGHGSLYRGEIPMIHNGADDNASGTAGVLELAQYFTANPTRHSLLFMAFSGEEMGLLGSGHWVNEPTIERSRVRAMYNLDMIGRLPVATRRLNVQGIGTSPVWKELVNKFNDAENFDLALIEDGHGSSDHSSFYSKDIPVLFFFTGLHTDYHRPSDDAHKLDYKGQEEVVRYIAEIVEASDALESIPFTRVQKTENQKVSRFNVYVGTIPDYGYSEGFKITGTSPGSPAEEAGMQDGDILLLFGTTEISSIYDYMTALSRHKPGEEVPVVVRRGEDEITLTVKLVSK